MEKLKRVNETRRPMISRLSSTAKNQVTNHKRQLMAAVRRIDYLVAERDEAVKKCEQMKKYVRPSPSPKRPSAAEAGC